MASILALNELIIVIFVWIYVSRSY